MKISKKLKYIKLNLTATEVACYSKTCNRISGGSYVIK